MRLFHSSRFKALYERSKEQFLSKNAFCLTFYQQKVDKNAMLRNFVSITGRIYQWDFPKVSVSKRSTIGAMSSSFRRAPYIQPSISKISAKKQCLGVLFLVLTKFISETFPKSCLKSALRKERWAAPFVERPVFNFLSAKTRQKCNA